MPPWTFRELLLGDSGVVARWWANIRPKSRRSKVRNKFRAMLMAMAPLKRDQWPNEWVTQLKGYRQVFELRFKVINIVHRPLFCFGPGRSEITFVFPQAEEASDEFVPRDAPQRASALIDELKNGRHATREIDLDAPA